jgi:hypothetical protein
MKRKHNLGISKQLFKISTHPLVDAHFPMSDIVMQKGVRFCKTMVSISSTFNPHFFANILMPKNYEAKM